QEIPTNAEVNREAGSGPEVNQPKQRQLGLAADQGGLALGASRGSLITQQEGGKAVWYSGDIAGEVNLAAWQVGAGAASNVVPVDAAELEVMFAAVYGDTVGDLVDVNIIELARLTDVINAREAGDVDDWQPFL